MANAGESDLGGQDVPLYLRDTAGTLGAPWTLGGDFTACQSGPLPVPFEPGDEAGMCLVYLVPDGGRVRDLVFQPTEGYDPISWIGEVREPSPVKLRPVRAGAADLGRARSRSDNGGMTVVPDSLTLGSLRVDTPVVLAPMAGITNAAYRRLCAEQGAGLYVSEMITSRGLVEGDEVTKKMLTFDELETVRSVQLYGTDPVYIGKAVEILCADHGVAHVDLNFGCPVPKVTRKGGGGALPWKRGLLGEILEHAVAAATPYDVPVTMKTRKGLDDDHLTYLDAGRIAQETGVAAIALHGRTVQQAYSGEADWDAIAAARRPRRHPRPRQRRHLGGCRRAADGRADRRRGRRRRPRLPRAGRGCSATWPRPSTARTSPPCRSSARSKAMMRRHAELLSEHMGEERGCKEFRKHITWYLKGFPAGGELRHQLALVDSLAALDELLAGLDDTAPFPERELGTPRGRQGSPRKRVVLPDGWLDDTDGRGRAPARGRRRDHRGLIPRPRRRTHGSRHGEPEHAGIYRGRLGQAEFPVLHSMIASTWATSSSPVSGLVDRRNVPRQQVQRISAVAQHRHKREAPATTPRPSRIPRSVLVSAPLAVVATLSAVTMGVLAAEPATNDRPARLVRHLPAGRRIGRRHRRRHRAPSAQRDDHRLPLADPHRCEGRGRRAREDRRGTRGTQREQEGPPAGREGRRCRVDHRRPQPLGRPVRGVRQAGRHRRRQAGVR